LNDILRIITLNREKLIRFYIYFDPSNMKPFYPEHLSEIV